MQLLLADIKNKGNTPEEYEQKSDQWFADVWENYEGLQGKSTRYGCVLVV